jgi:glyoxylase-like metal-dependent hydrolase (beta-lactamase superfamily II)
MRQVAEDVLVHESEFLQSNAVVVRGKAGVLLIDAGITDAEMVAMADDLGKLGQSVVLGFSTHPHWDHLLWHTKLGQAPRYGTARCAAEIKAFLSKSDWKDDIAQELPPEIEVPLDLMGQIIGLPPEAKQIPWGGPKVRIIEHNAHASGHAALLIEERKVLVAGDMLSDVLIPMLNFGAADPTRDYLAALQLLEDVADDVDVFVPGHGSIGDADELRTRINRDRVYVQALRDGGESNDPRIGPSAKKGWEWVSDVHAGQVQQLTQKSEHAGTPNY